QFRVAAEEPRLGYRSGVTFGEYTGEPIREPEACHDHPVDLNDALDPFTNVAGAFCSAEVRHQLCAQHPTQRSGHLRRSHCFNIVAVTTNSSNVVPLRVRLS